MTLTMQQPARRLRQGLRRLLRPARLDSLRPLVPLSVDFGYDRGTPVDRYYIERFLERCQPDIKGRVLEVKEPLYARRFGHGVDRYDVLDIDPGNTSATFVGDLVTGNGLPTDAFDCFILTQTLQYIYLTDAAVCEARRALRPGGVLLATVPAVSRLSYPPDVASEYWRFTAACCSRLFGDAFGPDHVTVQAHGNLMTCLAFLTGLAREELTAPELDVDDPLYPLVVTVRAVKV
jgi:SAM-dependent methyltransferase